MEKVVFFGTDLHGFPTELASKTVRKLKLGFPQSKILSIQNVKEKTEEDIVIIPRTSKIRYLRLFIQAILLPFYFLFLKSKGYKKIYSFWTVNNTYHYFLFYFLKSAGFKINFTIISGYDKNYSSLKFCDTIICQSEKMKNFISKLFPNKEIILIYPGVNLNLFKPSKKENDFAIFSVPYDPKDLSLRGIDKVLSFLKLNPEFNAIIVSRSKKTSVFISELGLKNVILISESLTEKKLASISSKSKIMPILYFSSDSPDMPLSAVEALSSGCPIICSKGNGLSNFIIKNKCGVISEDLTKYLVELLIHDKKYASNARNAAIKYLDEEKMISSYLSLT